MMEAKIKLTKTMLDKSIIDANKSVREFLEQELDYSYDKLEADVSDGKYYHNYWCNALYEDDTPTIVTFYKSRTRGDRRISIKNLRKFAEEGDTVKLRSEVVMVEDCIFDVRVVVYKEDDDQQGETVAA
jgi:hypothetical protein|tara:strand:- start:119 stop:505 length:387 start_codon:yes stop_codon:yes gene_type:complete